MTTFYELPPIGGEVKLFIHQSIREDAHQLYGFTARGDREAFRQLLKVSGVGPKMALAVLSNLSVDELAQVLLTGDVVRLSKTPGVGKKTAERLILELGGKLVSPESSNQDLLAKGPVQTDEVVQALVALGYSEREAGAAVKTLPKDIPLEDGIRQSLKYLARG